MAVGWQGRPSDRVGRARTDLVDGKALQRLDLLRHHHRGVVAKPALAHVVEAPGVDGAVPEQGQAVGLAHRDVQHRAAFEPFQQGGQEERFRVGGVGLRSASPDSKALAGSPGPHLAVRRQGQVGGVAGLDFLKGQAFALKLLDDFGPVCENVQSQHQS